MLTRGLVLLTPPPFPKKRKEKKEAKKKATYKRPNAAQSLSQKKNGIPEKLNDGEVVNFVSDSLKAGGCLYEEGPREGPRRDKIEDVFAIRALHVNRQHELKKIV